MTGDHDPDLRGLADERTYLAWSRTALALGATGAVLIGGPEVFTRPGRVAGFALMALGAFLWATGLARYREAGAAQREDRPVTRQRSVRLLAAAVSVSGVVALVLSVLPGATGG